MTIIQRFGLLGVFLLMVPESAGIPIPSEVTLLFSGFAVSRHWMSFALAVAAATGGNVMGSLIAYGLGTLLADRGLMRRWQPLLGQHPLRSVFLARLLPLARTFVSLPAGARRLPVMPFLALTALGCALWAAAFVLAGVLAGASWEALSSWLSRALAGGGLLVAAVWLSRRRRRRSDQ